MPMLIALNMCICEGACVKRESHGEGTEGLCLLNCVFVCSGVEVVVVCVHSC